MRFQSVLKNTRTIRFRALILLLIAATGLISFRALENRTIKKSFLNTGLNGTPYIIIDKSDYELHIFDDDGWYGTYPVVFGSKNLGDKMMEGDRKTPEGTYHIITKRPHEKWAKIMLIDYPNKTDIQKFNERKSKGLVPASAKIGSGIGIHGTWPRDEMAVDYFQNWTNGCISMKREEMNEVYSMIPVGTKVTIRR